MDARQVNQTFDLVGYTGGFVTLHKSGAYYIGACPLCGGRDRFQIKHTNNGDLWICRKCAGDKYHSSIDFLMSYYHEEFREALNRAGGEVENPRRELGNGKPVQKSAPVQVIPSQEWQADAWALVEAAAARLMGDDFEGLPARHYLKERGIDRGSIYRNWLGYAVVYKRPAIVIPHLDLGDVITAVKYRFIDDLASQDKGKRFAMMTGSIPNLFGLQHIRAIDTTLLFVEGELNAISVLQTEPGAVSVISAGSEGNGKAALLKAIARQYERAIVWTDDPAKARTIRERMERPDARILKSPVIECVKYDANQMLQAGLLMDFISAELQAVCLGIPYTPAELERVTA